MVECSRITSKRLYRKECLFDRSITSRKVNLFDLGQKYADVMPTAELVENLEALPF